MSVTQAPAVVHAPAQASENRPRTWVRRIHGGGSTAEHCPSWCTATHVNDQDVLLDDLMHDSTAVAMRFPMQPKGTDEPMAWPLLSASIRQWPYEENGPARMPMVAFDPSGDNIIELDPEGLAQVIAQIRVHADRLEGVLVQLVHARAEHAGAIATA